MPKLASRTAPEPGLTGLEGLLQRLPVYESDHQHVAACEVLDNCGQQTIRIELQFGFVDCLSSHLVECRLSLTVRSTSHREASRAEIPFCLRYREFPEMKNGSGEHRRGFAFAERLVEMFQSSGAARGDHRNRYRFGDRASQLEVVSVSSPVAIHAGQQNLAGPKALGASRPFHCVQPGSRSAAVTINVPTRSFNDGAH